MHQVRLPPLPRRPKTNASLVGCDTIGSPWGIDNPALRQLSTGGARSINSRNHGLRRSFRSRRVKLPEIAGRKQRPSGSARSSRSNISAMSAVTITSTKSFDMFRHRVVSRTPGSVLSAATLHFPLRHPNYHRKSSAASTLSIHTVSTVQLPPINAHPNRSVGRDDVVNTALGENDNDGTDDIDDDESSSSCWPDASVDGESDYTRVDQDNYHDNVQIRSYNLKTADTTDGRTTLTNRPQSFTTCEDRGTSCSTTPDASNDYTTTSRHVADDSVENAAPHFPQNVYANEHVTSLERESSGIYVRGEDAPDDSEAGVENKIGIRSFEDDDEDETKELSAAEGMKRLFGGDFRRLPPMPRTAVRILLWASPSGFREEREWIKTKCYPKLQEFCAEKGLEFQLIDLDGEGYDHVTDEARLDAYIDQLALCEQLSAGPTVLALVNGDDLPRPLPASLPEEHFNILLEVAERKDLPNRKLIESHYRRGTGSGDTLYELKPTPCIESRDKNHDDWLLPLNQWGAVAVRLREVFRKALVSAVVDGKLAKEQAQQYLESDSKRKVSQYVSSFPTRSLCYIRNSVDPGHHITECDGEKGQEILPTNTGLDMSRTISSEEILPSESRSRGRVYNIERLSQNETEPASITQQRCAYLNRLCADVTNDVRCVVSDELCRAAGIKARCVIAPLYDEVLHHARVQVSRKAAYIGPEGFLWKIRDYLTDDNHSMVPLIITGTADTNKSQLMASFTSRVRTWIVPKPVVVVRFLGTSPHSCDTKRVLIGVIYQICDAYNMAVPRFDDVNRYDRTLLCFSALLESVAVQHGAARPLVVVFDSLERLSSLDGNHTSAWIPSVCPPNVYILASVASDNHNLINTLKVKLTEERCFLSLDRPSSPETLVPCSGRTDKSRSPSKDRTESVNSSCTSDASDLHETETQPSLPSHRDFETPTLADVIQGKLNRLEDRYGVVVMGWTLSYLIVGEGITEVELQDAMSSNIEVMEEVFIGSDVSPGKHHSFPHILWALIRRDLNGLLESRLIDGKAALSIGNEQFRESVEIRYLTEDRLRECWRQFTALHKGRHSNKHYEESDDDDSVIDHLVAPQPLLATNHRKLRRLPYTLYNSGPFDWIENDLRNYMLCNFLWILVKMTGLHFYNTIEDYNMVRFHDDEIEFVRDLLMLCKHVLIRDPSQLANQIVARISDRMLRGKSALQKLYSSAREWIQTRSDTVTLFPKYPYLPGPSGYLRSTIQGPWHVLGVSEDETHLILWGRETGLEVWNASTQECLHHFCTPFTWEDTLVSWDSKVVFQTEDTRLLGWDVRTGQRLHNIDLLPSVSDTGRRQNPNVDDSFITPMCVSKDGTMAVVRMNKPEMAIAGKGLAVVDLQKEVILHTAVDATGDRVSNCLLANNDCHLVLTETQVMQGEVSVVRVYDVMTMDVLGEHVLDPGLTIIPEAMHLSEDGSMVVIGCRPDHIVLFQTRDCQPLSLPTEPVREENTQLVDLKLLSGNRLLALSVDVTQVAVLKQCDLTGNVQGPIMSSGTGQPKLLMTSRDDSLACIGYMDNGSVDVWDLEKACLLYTIKGHTGHITSCLLADGGHSLYIGATDASIKVWKFDCMMSDKGRKLKTASTHSPRGSPARNAGPSEAGDGLTISYESSANVVGEEDASVRGLGDGNPAVTTDRESELHDGDDCQKDFPRAQESQEGLQSEDDVGLVKGSGRSPQQSVGKGRYGKDIRSRKDSSEKDERSLSVKRSTSNTSREEKRNSSRSVIDDTKASTSRTQENMFHDGKTEKGNNSDVVEAKYEQNELEKTASQPTPQELITMASESCYERESTVTTARSDDTDAKLEEIFRKLDQQAMEGSPRFGSMDDLITTTSVLGYYGEILDGLPTDMTNLHGITPSEDGRYVVASYQKGSPLLWSLETGQVVLRTETPWDTGVISQTVLSPDGRTLFGVSRLGLRASQVTNSENCIRVWDMETGICSPLPDPPVYADTLALTPDMTKVVFLHKREEETRFKVLDVNTQEKIMVGQVACKLQSSHFFVTSNLRYVITCDPGTSIAVWSLTNEDEYGVAKHTVLPLATIPPAMHLMDKDGLLLIGTGFGNVFCLKLDDVSTLRHRFDSALLFVEDRHVGEVLTLTMSRDQRLLVTSSTDATMKVIDYAERKVLYVLKGHTDMITCVDISRDSQLVASGSHDKTAKLWSATTGQLLATFCALQDVFGISFSWDSRQLAALVDQGGERKLVMLDIVKGTKK